MTLFESLATILGYPGQEYHDAVAAALAARTLESERPLVRFAESVAGMSTADLQELYIRTFDLNPVCALEIGWHLFGENYDRGILLVRMRALLDKHGIRESSELPDHLTHALRLLDRMSDADALDFAAACVVPALQKMREAIGGCGNPYESVLDAILRLLYARFPQIPLPAVRETLPLRGGGEGGRRPDAESLHVGASPHPLSAPSPRVAARGASIERSSLLESSLEPEVKS